MLLMKLDKVKNTVLLFVLLLISCGNKFKSETLKKNDDSIIVGANNISKYISLLQGKRIGVLANQTSVIYKNDNSYTHLIDSLISLNVNVTTIFSPEHGFRGNKDAGESVEDGVDIKTGVPIISLHGSYKKPKKETLENLDIMIFDIQDIGVRFYTYLSTLHYIMESCAEANIPLVILDRPNPNGHYVDGPTMEKEHRSFLGMHEIPLVHGMTLAEYAQMIIGEKWLSDSKVCELIIVSCSNYNHDKSYSLPIRPSPNIPNDLAVKLYPSLGLFEGTNINAGRGTEFQFQRYGAPFLDSTVMKFTYIPHPNFGAKNPKHNDILCFGENLQNVLVKKELTLKWLIKAYENCKDKSQFFLKKGFTKHAGTVTLQTQIEKGLTEEDIKATWIDDLEAFKKIRKKYLIYD